jgi:hypothetical protein
VNTGQPSATTLIERITHVREQIAAACARANRPPESVTLVAVSKTRPPETILAAAQCGLTHFGENRIEEAGRKIPEVNRHAPQLLTWHMVGHVQSRKAEDVVATFDLIHSLESVKLADRYARFGEAQGRTVSVLLEVNVSGEESKSGFDAVNWAQDAAKREALWANVRHILALPTVRVLGLMTMAPIVEEMEQTRRVFAALRQLRDALATDFTASAWSTLSMGMTDDYLVAIEEGATMVRIGRAIFGDRTY